MPFESEKQRRLCWVKYNAALKQGKKPKWDCHEFAKDTPKGLPQYKNKEALGNRESFHRYILDMYDKGKQDDSHGKSHVESVRDISMDIANRKGYSKRRLLEDAALLHDIGLIKDNNRDLHHILGADVVKNDPVISKRYNKKSLTALMNAIRSHRTSDKKYVPRSILSKIISDADKIDGTALSRAYKYNAQVNPNVGEKGNLLQAAEYLRDRFSPSGKGFKSLHFPESRDAVSSRLVPLLGALKRKDYKLLKELAHDNSKTSSIDVDDIKQGDGMDIYAISKGFDKKASIAHDAFISGIFKGATDNKDIAPSGLSSFQNFDGKTVKIPTSLSGRVVKYDNPLTMKHKDEVALKRPARQLDDLEKTQRSVSNELSALVNNDRKEVMDGYEPTKGTSMSGKNYSRQQKFNTLKG